MRGSLLGGVIGGVLGVAAGIYSGSPPYLLFYAAVGFLAGYRLLPRVKEGLGAPTPGVIAFLAFLVLGGGFLGWLVWAFTRPGAHW